MPKTVSTFKCRCRRQVTLCSCHSVSNPFQYGTLQFSKFEELVKKGYHAAMDILEKFEEEGRLPSVSVDGKDGPSSGKKKGKSARRNSI